MNLDSLLLVPDLGLVHHDRQRTGPDPHEPIRIRQSNPRTGEPKPAYRAIQTSVQGTKPIDETISSANPSSHHWELGWEVGWELGFCSRRLISG